MRILDIGAEQEDDGGNVRVVEAAFRTVPREHTTFLVWRITETGAELLPRNHYGTFYDTEAYLVYSASLPSQPAGPDVIRREIKENGSGECAERVIHAWAGERSGSLGSHALRRATQLSNHLGVPVVVFRETAMKESARLLSYFRDGIRILRSASSGSEARLFLVRGRRPLVAQLESVAWSQLAADGVFVVDTPPLALLWLGRAANLLDKIVGAKIAYRMARGADKGMIPRRIAIAHDGYEQTLPAPDRAALDGALRLAARRVRPAESPAETPRPARLYRATQPPRAHTMPASSKPAARLEEVKRAPLFREDLADDIAYRMARGADKGMIPRRIAIAHDGYEQTLPAPDRAALDGALRLAARRVRPAESPAETPRPARLYRATQPPRAHTMPASSKPAARLEEVKRAPLFREDLADDIAYRMARGADKGMIPRRIAIAHDGYEQTLPAPDRAALDGALRLAARRVRPAESPAETPRPARLYRATQPPRAHTMPASSKPAARLEEVKRAPLFREDLADDIAYRMARGADKGMIPRRIAIAHDGYEQTLPAPDRAALDGALRLAARRVRPAESPAETPRPARLYRATQPPRAHTMPASSKPAARLEEVKRAPLFREDLADDGVYVVDSGSRGVWAWIGAAASPNAARGALAAARGLARARRIAAPVAAAPSGREPLEFAALFQRWPWADARRDSRLRAARSATTRLDAMSLASNAWLAAEAQLLDDGSGVLRTWRVTDAAPALTEIERPQTAAFFDKDCYIVLYTYHAINGDHSILYYWMGGSSPNDLRNLGAKEAKDLYTKLGRLPVQAWIYQGKEPAHFLQIFKGRMITYVGSATDYDPTGRRISPPPRALIRVSGQYAREARGVEVRDYASRDYGGSCYVLRSPTRSYVWCAATATGDEREVAKNMAAADHTLLVQGKETAEFWSALGARRELLAAAPAPTAARPLPPRLFYTTTNAQHYTFEEIIPIRQVELAPEMAAILDAHCSVFVWLGAHACSRAKDNARALADAYLSRDPAARDQQTPILAVSQGREPPNFTGFFPHWKQSMWKGHKTFAAIVSALEGKAIVQSGNSALQSGNSANQFDQYEKYPMSVLRGPKEHLPSDVDPLTKELYLTHDDFVSTFHMPYDNFRSLPGWKQKDLKKAVGLF